MCPQHRNLVIHHSTLYCGFIFIIFVFNIKLSVNLFRVVKHSFFLYLNIPALREQKVA